MALPLLLPLLGLGAAAGVGQARQRQQQVQQREARQQRASDVQATLQGAGMQFGPRVGTTPMEQQQLAGTVQALNSPFPDLQAQGMAQLEAMSPSSQIQLERDRIARDRERLELRAMQNPAATTDPEFLRDTAKQFRAEKRSDLAPYLNGLNNYDNLMAQLGITGDQGNPAAAYASLMMYLQGWDNSVVRGTEVNTFRGGFGPTGNIAALWNQWRGGGFTDNQIRDAMIESINVHVRSQYDNMVRIRDEHDAQIGRVAQQFGFGEENFRGLTRVPGARARQFGPAPTVRGGTGMRTNTEEPKADEDNIIWD